MRCAGNLLMSTASPATMFWLQIAVSAGTSLGFMVRPILRCSACTALSGWSNVSSPIVRQNRDRLQPIML